MNMKMRLENATNFCTYIIGSLINSKLLFILYNA